MSFSSVADLDTLPKRLLHNAANWPGDVAMREKDLGVWRVYSWSDCRNQVRLAALGLKALGVSRGESVALIGRNRPNWIWGELAAQSLGCMTLGIYEDVLAAEAGYLCRAAGVTAVLCEDEEQVDKLLELEGTDLRLIVFHDERGLANRDDPRLVAWARLQALGRELFERQPGAFEAEVAQGRGEDVAILCTTSGTTASPSSPCCSTVHSWTK